LEPPTERDIDNLYEEIRTDESMILKDIFEHIKIIEAPKSTVERYWKMVKKQN